MSEWKEVYLQDVYNIGSGLSKPAEDFGSGFPFLSFKEVFNNFFVPEKLSELVQATEKERLQCSIKRGDVFLTRTSETVKELGMSCVALKDYENATFNGFTKRLRPKENVDIVPEYAGYYFRTSKFRKEVTSMSSASTRASLNIEMIGRLKIILPSKPEQSSIASILKNLDDKIENLRRQNETLEQIARSLFKHWFIDFEFPNADGKPYKSSGGAMFASELGDIPEEWKVGKLKDISDITSSKRIFSAEYVESGIPFYRSKEIIELHAGQNVTTELYISEEKFNEIKSKFEVPKADEILLTSVGTIGVPYLIKKSDQFYFKDGNLTWIKRFINGFSGVVIYYWLKSDSTQDKIKQNTIGSTQKALTIQALGNISIFIPDAKTLSRYTEFIKIVNSKIENNIYQIQTLTKTRDSLLPKLMSGQLRVKE